MASKKPGVILVLTLLAFADLIESMGLCRLDEMFPLREEETGCFTCTKTTEDNDKKGNCASKKIMTSSQEPPSSTSSDKFPTSDGVEGSTRGVSGQGVSTEHISGNAMASDDVMTSSQDPALSTSSDESTTSDGVAEASQVAVSLGSSTEPVVENPDWKEAMTSSQEPPLSTSSDESTTSHGFQEIETVSSRGVTTESATGLSQWIPWNNSSYTFVHTTLTWENAAQVCSSMTDGAHLVFIESELENREVSRLAQVASEGQNEQWWIGLTDQVTEGKWQWYNASVNYTNWDEGQPSNTNAGEDCALLGHGLNTAMWNDIPCTWQRKFICEDLKTSLN